MRMHDHDNHEGSGRHGWHGRDHAAGRQRCGHHGRRHGFADGDDDVRLGERDHGPRGGRHRHGFFDGAGRGGREGFGRGGGGRFFGPGDLRLLLLWLIGEKPRHGYELIKAVEQLVGGAYSPSPGSVYPILSLLEDMGQIRGTSTASARKLFEITDEGRKVLGEEQPAIEGLLSRMRIMAKTMGGMRPPEQVFQVFQTLKTAVALNPRAWTEDEVRRVCGIINSAIAEIQADGSGEVPA
jgi:DNA-binding PadR family transcriptional regulator